MSTDLSAPARVILSGFADEVSETKDPREQLAVTAALGLQWYSPRFLDMDGSGAPCNVVYLSDPHLKALADLQRFYGVRPTCVGTAVGKTRILDIDDGSGIPFLPLSKVLDLTRRACTAAHELEGAPAIRGFTFYPPRGAAKEPYLPAAVDYCGRIADICQCEKIVYAAEVEAHLVGCNGWLLHEIWRQVNNPYFRLVLDVGNLQCQGYDNESILEQARLLAPALSHMHVKAYVGPRPSVVGDVDEDALKHFVPVDHPGDCHHDVLYELMGWLVRLHSVLLDLGLPGFSLELEPHVTAGGRLGGSSGPGGFGVALRAVCLLLDRLGIEYHLRDFRDVQTARGY